MDRSVPGYLRRSRTTLRRVDAKDLVMQAGAGLPKAKRATPSGKVLDDHRLADVFGIEMAEIAPATIPAVRRRKSTPAKVGKTPVKVATTTARKTVATTEPKGDAVITRLRKPAKTSRNSPSRISKARLAAHE